MERKLISSQIDHALSYIIEHQGAVIDAHLHLGVPLEDALCHTIRKSLNQRVVDKQQLTLFVRKENE